VSLSALLAALPLRVKRTKGEERVLAVLYIPLHDASKELAQHLEEREKNRRNGQELAPTE
jgi:hypothetical protein